MIKKFLIKPHSDDDNLFVQYDRGAVWFKTQTRALYADTDTAQVVYHANYLKYFEIGRTEILRYNGFPYKLIEEKNIYHPIVHLEMDFRSPAKYDDLLDIYVHPKTMETVKFTIEYKILNNESNQLLVEGTTVHCCTINGDKVCPVDDIVKNLFNCFKDKEQGLA